VSLAPISIRALATALGPRSREVVALVGGGGKTTALFALGRQLGGRVILSTTTKMGSDRTGGHRPLLGPSRRELADALDRDRVVLAWRAVDDHRAEGYPGTDCDGWRDLADHIVLEADGSRRRPFKAPAAHEPVVPSSTTLLVACVGAAAFDAPIEVACHRPGVAADLLGCEVGDRLGPVALSRLLLHEEGSRKHCPASARFVVLLNQVTDAHADYVDALLTAIDGAAPVVAIEPFSPEDSPEA
jgi:probable selenium-dependent hydroxylase accessory protein YqeC